MGHKRSHERMAALKPNAASYARSSYARELQGDVDGAIERMRMAAEATGAQDPESDEGQCRPPLMRDERGQDRRGGGERAERPE